MSMTELQQWEYLASYGDLIQAFGPDPVAAQTHYDTYGAGEGRAITFDAWEYLASYGDLIQAFGPAPVAAAQHYVTYGYAEGRNADAFNAWEYLASYNDLIAAFHTDVAAATQHYVTYGYAEHRDTSVFDAQAYLDNYADLQAAFGTNLEQAAQHYVTYGFAEGRTSAVGLTVTAVDATEGQGDVVFRLELARALSSDVSVNVSTGGSLDTAEAGSDYTPVSQHVTFAAGETVKFITVAVNDDTQIELTETVTLNISAPSRLQVSGDQVATITSDDVAPVATYSLPTANAVSINEGQTVTFTVQTTNVALGTALTYTLDGTATSADLNGAPLSGTVYVDAAGQASLTVAATNDLTTETAETLTFTYTNSVGDGFSSSEVTINDTSKTPNMDLRLTAGTDKGDAFKAGAGNDTFDGITTGNSLNTSDVLDGGDGTDTVTALLNLGQTIRPSLTSIEVIDVTAEGGTAPTVDLLNAHDGVTTVRSTQSTNNVSFNNVNKIVETELVLTNKGVTVNYTDAALAGASNTIVSLDNAAGGTVTIANAAASTAAAEQVTVNSNVGVNTIKVVNTTATSANYTLSVGGEAALTLTTGGANATIIDAASASGALNVTNAGASTFTYAGGTGTDTLNVGGQSVTSISNTETIFSTGASTITVAAADTTDVTVTDDAASANNDVITLAGGNDTVNAGDGIDNINVGEGTNRVVIAGVNLGVNLNDTLTGGTGTDTLSVTGGGAVVDVQFTGVSGFEVLELQTNTGATLDTSALLDGVAQGISTINGASGPGTTADNAIILEEQVDDLTLAINGGETTDPVADTDTVTVQDTGAPSAGTFTLNIQDIETVTHAATAGALTVNVTGGTQGVTVFGSAALDSFTGGAGADTLNSGLNGVGVTDFFDGQGGVDILYAEGGATNFRNVEIVNITAASTVTEVAGGSTIDVTVNDNLNNNTIVLLGGDDTVNAAAGLDNINVGEGANRVVFAMAADLTGDGVVGGANDDTITGGTGTDTLSVNGVVLDGQFVGVTSFEVLDLQAASGATLGALAKAAGITTIEGASDAGALADNAVTIVQQAAAWTLAIEGGEDFIDQTADNAVGADDVDDRDNASTNLDNDTVTVVAGGAAALTLNVTNVELVDASAASAYVVVNVIDSPVRIDTDLVDADGVVTRQPRNQNVNIFGSASADSLTGGVGNDTLQGNNGRDTLIGGLGDDTYVMTFDQFNTNADVITEDIAGGSSDTIRVTSGVSVTVSEAAIGGTRFANVENAEFVGTPTAIFTVDLGANTANNTDLRTFSAGAGATLDIAVSNQYDADSITIKGGAGADLVNYRFTPLLEANITTAAITFNDSALGGNDTVVTGAGVDVILLIDGDNQVITNSRADTITLGTGIDNVDAGAGSDTIFGGANVTDLDTIIGGLDADTLNLEGVYTGVAALTNSNLISQIESIVLHSQGDGIGNLGFQYDITVGNNNDVDAGATTTDILTVDASALLADADSEVALNQAETLNFDANGATLFMVNVIGGAGNDTILGGGLADTLIGGEGADVFRGRAGNDSIVLTETIAAHDTVKMTVNGPIAGRDVDAITDFHAGADILTTDLLDFSPIVIGIGNWDGTVYTDVDIIAPIVANNDVMVYVGTQLLASLVATTSLEAGFTLIDNGGFILIQAVSTTATTANVYHVSDSNGPAPTVTESIQLIGTVNFVTGDTFADFKEANA
jgi:Ca2+-binding RTX toxin-like protein